jgi:hypothetical protein
MSRQITINNTGQYQVVDVASSSDNVLTPITSSSPAFGVIVETLLSALGSNQTINGITNIYVPSATRTIFQTLNANYTDKITTPTTKTATGWWSYYQNNSAGFNTTIFPSSSNTLSAPILVTAGTDPSHHFLWSDNLGKYEWQKNPPTNLNSSATVTKLNIALGSAIADSQCAVGILQFRYSAIATGGNIEVRSNTATGQSAHWHAVRNTNTTPVAGDFAGSGGSLLTINANSGAFVPLTVPGGLTYGHSIDYRINTTNNEVFDVSIIILNNSVLSLTIYKW